MLLSKIVGFAALGGMLGLPACAPVSTHEADLLTAKCTLVERMNVVQAMKADEDFEVGVRCGADAKQSYHTVLDLSQSYEYAVIPNSPLQGGPQTLEVVFCDDGRRGQVQGNIDRLNAMAAETGFRFSLRPKSARCQREVKKMTGALTSAMSKDFDRQLQ